MAESINQRTAYVPDDLTSNELRALLQSVLTDLTSLRTSLNQLRTDYNASTVPTTAGAVTLNTTA
jgi:hypothetical protein